MQRVKGLLRTKYSVAKTVQEQSSLLRKTGYTGSMQGSVKAILGTAEGCLQTVLFIIPFQSSVQAFIFK